MIMQEFEPRRRITSTKPSTNNKIDDIPIKSKQVSNNSTSTAPLNNVPIFKVKRQTPFPYLKRTSIRVDLILKKQKLADRKKNIEKLRMEKKQLETENLILKGQILQMEFVLNHLKASKSSKISFKSQECQTKPSETCPILKVSSNMKNSIVKCSKCEKCLQSQYFKYHDRVCGNTQLNRLLSNKDLKRLQWIRMNQMNSETKTVTPKNNWRQKRQELLTQIKKAQSKNSSKNCIIFYRPKKFRSNINQ